MKFKTWPAVAAGAFGLAFSAMAPHAAAAPVEIGKIVVCYRCTAPLPVSDPQFTATLAANPDASSDGVIFEFVNTSNYNINGGVISITNPVVQQYDPAYDQFNMPSISAKSEYFLIPGSSNDGLSHPYSGLFAVGSYGLDYQDLSDNYGGVEGGSVFRFSGSTGGLNNNVFLQTAGSSTAIPQTFTPDDPGLVIAPYSLGSGYTPFVSNFNFYGDIPTYPDFDSECGGCYYATVATLWANVPEPSSWAVLLSGLGMLGGALRYRRKGHTQAA